MCGVVGIMDVGGKQVLRQDLVRLTATLSHRGPDGSGIFLSRDRSVGIGHTRLSILDLSPSAGQPMTSPDGRFTLSFNGEIYNFLELREQLTAKGHVFRTNGDAEVVLIGFMEWGKGLFEKLNGMWAVLIWDERTKALLACRDRFGVKPLYYFRCGSTIYFSSETQSFGKMAPRREVDKYVLGQTILDVYYPEGRGVTIYKNCFPVRAGHFIEVTANGKVSATRWWALEDNVVDIAGNYQARVGVFQELFYDACRKRLRSDVPLGTALSGGIDSSAVFSGCATVEGQATDREMIANRMKGLSTPYTLSLSGTKWDEKHYAEAVARMYGKELSVVRVDYEDVFRDIEAESQRRDNIYLSPDVTPLLYKKMSDDGLKISIDGHGADEVFFGYPDMIEAYQKAMGAGGNDTPHRRRGFPQLKRYLRFAAARVRAASVRDGATFSRRYRPWVFVPGEREDRPPKTELSPDKNISLNEIYRYRLPTILRNFDQSSMRHGIEIRAPFLDWRVVRFGFSLPPDDKFRTGQTKSIIRDAFRDKLPAEVIERSEKIGINSPLEYWMASKPERFLDWAHDGRFLRSDVWDGHSVRDSLVRMVKGGCISKWDSERLWPIFNAYLLTR